MILSFQTPLKSLHHVLLQTKYPKVAECLGTTDRGNQLSEGQGNETSRQG